MILENIRVINGENLNSGLYIALIHACKIPPHIALIYNGKYFCVTVNGSTIKRDIYVLMRNILKRDIETLFVQLNLPIAYTAEDLEKKITSIFRSYPSLDADGITCLSPIKDFCFDLFHLDVSNVNFIFELLPKLQMTGAVSGCYHCNMEKRFLSNNKFALKIYSMSDIRQHINSVAPHSFA